MSETPLTNLRVIDFTHFIAGPFCTMILADFGAEVVKIESPEGDGFRQYPPHRDGEGAPYLWTNRNKASVVLDLKTQAGRDVARALMDEADVVVENFSTGVMQRFGLDYESVKARNPRLVYCSISAYGRAGPYADRVGFDPIAQAESGFVSMNGRPDDEGMRAGPSIMDMATAMLSCNAILAALHARARTGRGQLIESNLLGMAVNMLGNFHMAYLMSGASPKRFGNWQVTAVPVGAFETKTGPIYIACANDGTFRRLMTDVLQAPALASDPRFLTSAARRENNLALRAIIADAFADFAREELLARMQASGVPGGAVRSVGEALDSPEVRALGILGETTHEKLGIIPNVGLPLTFSDTPVRKPRGAPALGADSARVLRELLGFDENRIDALREKGAFGAAAEG
ncbi:MAG: CoA transferase [Hyphomicrobiales bacterium]|nr:CoA transferase [Hyphomicrobiales bacterium]